MQFAIYDPEGRIIQANQIYADAAGVQKYEHQVNELGSTYLKFNRAGLVSPDHWFIDNRKLARRPVMPIEVSKTVIRCGDDDSALLTNIPRGVRYQITAGADLIWPEPGQSELLDADQLEISVPVPCRYHVRLNLWPYQTFTVDIEAIA